MLGSYGPTICWTSTLFPAGGRILDAVGNTVALDHLRCAPLVPEPATALLLGSAIPGLLIWRRRRRAIA